MPVKAIIFDCFGVLTTDGWRHIRETMLTSEKALYQAQLLDRAVNTGEISYGEFTASVAELVGISVAEVSAIFNETHANGELFDYIRDYIRPHYKVGLLSNAAENQLDILFTSAQTALFDEVVLSYQAGVVKPDAAIYALITAKLGVLAQECIFIDDVDRYVVAACDQGMQGVVFTSTDQTIRTLDRLLT